MWHEKEFPVKPANTGGSDLIFGDESEIDALLQLQEMLIQETQDYLRLIPYAPKTISELRSLEAICFLVVVEQRVGLDGDLIETCFFLLDVTYRQVRHVVHVLGRIYGILTGNLSDFVTAFAQELRYGAGTLHGG